MTNRQATPEWLDALEKKYGALALQELAAQGKKVTDLTPEELDAFEKKHMARGLQELALYELGIDEAKG